MKPIEKEGHMAAKRCTGHTAEGKRCKRPAKKGCKTCGAKHPRKKATKKKATKKKATKKKAKKRSTKKKSWAAVAPRYKSGKKKGKIMSKTEAAKRGIRIPGYTRGTTAKKIVKVRRNAVPFAHLQSGPTGFPSGWQR